MIGEAEEPGEEEFLSAEEVIDAPGNLDDRTLVVDLSGTEESDEKLETFLAVTDEPWRRMNEDKEEINTALIVDESPQYCPYAP